MATKPQISLAETLADIRAVAEPLTVRFEDWRPVEREAVYGHPGVTRTRSWTDVEVDGVGGEEINIIDGIADVISGVVYPHGLKPSLPRDSNWIFGQRAYKWYFKRGAEGWDVYMNAHKDEYGTGRHKVQIQVTFDRRGKHLDDYSDVGGTGETMILTKDPFREQWFMKDSSDNHIGTFKSVEAAKQFVKEFGYRLRIEKKGGESEWFGDTAPTSLTYGTLPSGAEIESAMDGKAYNYSMGRSDRTMADHVGIPSSGTFDSDELYSILERLVGAWEEGDDHAGDFASGILETLGFEWI